MNVIRFLRRKTESPFIYDYKTIAQAMRYMRSHGYVRMPVVSHDGVYRGALDEGDLLWYLMDHNGYEACKDTKIEKVVCKGKFPAITITASDKELRDAALRDAFVPIIDDRGMYAGIITRDDILQYFMEKQRKDMLTIAAMA